MKKLSLLSIVIVCLLSAFLSDNAKAEQEQKKEDNQLRHKVRKAKHRLFRHKEGDVHVWHPDHSGQLEGTVIFLHGDGRKGVHHYAWRMAKSQFIESGRKSLFIVPEVLRNGYVYYRKGDSPVNHLKWKWKLHKLINFAARKIGAKKPRNHITLIAHSAGFLTAENWINYRYGKRFIKDIIYLDAMFGFHGQYVRWLKAKGTRFVIIAPGKKEQTKKRGIKFTKNYGEEVDFFNDIPKVSNLPNDWPKVTNIFLKRHSHTSLFSKGEVIPPILKGLRGGQVHISQSDALSQEQ